MGKEGRVTIQFGLGAGSHASTKPATPGQIKKLIEMGTSGVVADSPRGFVEWLIEHNMYRRRHDELWESLLSHWRYHTANPTFVDEMRIPAATEGTLAQNFRESRKLVNEAALYEGRLDDPSSIWQAPYLAAKEKMGARYFVNTIDRGVVAEMMGGEKGLYRPETALTPLQAHNALRECGIAYEGKDYLFYLGAHRGTFPYFMRAWKDHNPSGLWHMREEVWGKPSDGVENAYLVFGEKLPGR